MPVQTKIEEVKKHKLCLNCLRSNHYIKECVASGCKHCNKKHNTLLHLKSYEGKNSQIVVIDNKPNLEKTDSNQQEQSLATTSNSATVSYYSIKDQPLSQVLLSTAIVYVFDKYGHTHDCRILLDSGSQSNFISKEFSDKLEVSKFTINMPVGGLSNTITNISHKTHAVIQSRFNTFQIKLSFLIIPKITENLPLEPISVRDLKIPGNIQLADNTFHTPGKIDMLLGANVFWDLLCTQRIKLGHHQPILQKTRLGWIITGNLTHSDNSARTVCHFNNNQLSELLETFWKIEECENIINYSTEERDCESNFINTHKRDSNGRFVVSLPLKEDKTMLGESKDIAMKRLYAVERKQPELKAQYVQFMSEYKNLGHMTEVRDTIETDTSVKYYLPHHCVLKESSTTTKLRVVFDGSSKTSTGVALNDILMVGPTIQQDIFSIVLRFRTHRFVITADIEKMYRQVLVNETQRDLQRIVWRSSPDQPVKLFRLNTVTYGTATAPFLAVRCLHALASEIERDFPIASNIIKQDFYVDDLLTGGNTVDQVKSLKHDVTRILETAGFILRKWISNDPSVLEEQPDVNSDSTCIGVQSLKTLGLLWHPLRDEFHFTINIKSDRHKVTKRTVLAKIAQIFDPLGLLGPVIIKAKILLQQLWKLKGGWDDALPKDLNAEWTNYYSNLICLNDIVIPRRVLATDYDQLQIHAFCDSSELGYGTCIYSRSIDKDGRIIINLLCAKSRVAPLKKLSLPRLELCGALLLARLCKRVIEALNVTVDEVHCWTDSTIALAWIAGQPSRWKTFVANRVTEIQDLTANATWKHVKSADNPADVISRGIEPNQLATCSLWWNGPSWLSKDSRAWPQQAKYFDFDNDDNIPESRPQTFTLHVIHDCYIFERYSSLSRLRRVVAYCFRFKHNLLKMNSKRVGPLSVDELTLAMTALLKIAQAQEFPQEFAALSACQALHRSSKLLTLNPFLDNQGLIRVGGRLKHSNLSYDQKFPIVLPAKHILTRLIIREEHYKHLHAGVNYLLASIRGRFWPISAKNVVRNVLRKCIVCFRSRPKTAEKFAGDQNNTSSSLSELWG